MVMRLLDRVGRLLGAASLVVGMAVLTAPVMLAAQPEAAADEAHHRPGGEVNIQLPDLNQGDFLGMTGHDILLSGLVVLCSGCCLACGPTPR